MRKHLRGLTLLGLALFPLLGWSLLRATGDASTESSCGLTSVCDLAYALGRPVADSARRDLASAYPTPETSLLQVREMGARVGLRMTGVRASLAELASGGHWPAIIHLSGPDHFVVLLRSSADSVQLMDRGMPLARPREAIEGRYSGHALTLEQPATEGPGPRLELPAFDLEFAVSGAGQYVTHGFLCSNRGDRDLTLETRVPSG